MIPITSAVRPGSFTDFTGVIHVIIFPTQSNALSWGKSPKVTQQQCASSLIPSPTKRGPCNKQPLFSLFFRQAPIIPTSPNMITPIHPSIHHYLAIDSPGKVLLRSIRWDAEVPKLKIQLRSMKRSLWKICTGWNELEACSLGVLVGRWSTLPPIIDASCVLEKKHSFKDVPPTLTILGPQNWLCWWPKKTPVAIQVPTKGTLFIGRCQNTEVETNTFFVWSKEFQIHQFSKETRRLLNGKTVWWRIFRARIIKHL